MKQIPLFLISMLGLLAYSCSSEVKTVTLTNSLDTPRESETVELTKEMLSGIDLEKIRVRDLETKELLVSQTVDTDGDKVADLLLFQPQLAPRSTKQFALEEGAPHKGDTLCYSRFVPERIDDYTWENDRVAFRMYGPTAQSMVEKNIEGGIISSGIDCWLKKVTYPIIDSWYEKNARKGESYHQDTGEGLDNYHVGISRGCGGIAVKEEGQYYFSENFVHWKTLSVGAIRTSFELHFKNWKAGEKTIEKSLLVSLDRGQNLTRYEVQMTGTSQLAVGLVQHEGDGEVTFSENKKWMNYWQPHGDSELGTAVLTPKAFVDSEVVDTVKRDLNNAYLLLDLEEEKCVYYAGFAWKESQQFASQKAWEQYLDLFAKQLNAPIAVEVK